MLFDTTGNMAFLSGLLKSQTFASNFFNRSIAFPIVSF
jgi:hypothetical protein